MTYEDFFKDGDKFIYDSILSNPRIFYLVEVTDICHHSPFMKVLFSRLGDKTNISSSFQKKQQC